MTDAFLFIMDERTLQAPLTVDLFYEIHKKSVAGVKTTSGGSTEFKPEFHHCSTQFVAASGGKDYDSPTYGLTSLHFVKARDDLFAYLRGKVSVGVLDDNDLDFVTSTIIQGMNFGESIDVLLSAANSYIGDVTLAPSNVPNVGADVGVDEGTLEPLDGNVAPVTYLSVGADGDAIGRILSKAYDCPWWTTEKVILRKVLGEEADIAEDSNQYLATLVGNNIHPTVEWSPPYSAELQLQRFADDVVMSVFPATVEGLSPALLPTAQMKARYVQCEFLIRRYHLDVANANSLDDVMQRRNKKLEAIARLIRDVEISHFFHDGNQRTMVLLLNYLLVQNGELATILFDPYIFDGYASLLEIMQQILKGQKRYKDVGLEKDRASAEEKYNIEEQARKEAAKKALLADVFGW
eukprot:g5052.t1